MGRELRMVTKNWEHPRDENGHYIPLLNGPFKERLAEWEEENAQWQKGFRRNWAKCNEWKHIEDEHKNKSFEDWDGEKPKQEDYMPDWNDDEKTHFQMYEDTTEGTPISPVMDSPESLAMWLVVNNASAFGDQTASYEGWLSTINRGFAPSMILSSSKGLESGVDGLKD